MFSILRFQLEILAAPAVAGLAVMQAVTGTDRSSDYGETVQPDAAQETADEDQAADPPEPRDEHTQLHVLRNDRRDDQQERVLMTPMGHDPKRATDDGCWIQSDNAVVLEDMS